MLKCQINVIIVRNQNTEIQKYIYVLVVKGNYYQESGREIHIKKKTTISLLRQYTDRYFKVLKLKKKPKHGLIKKQTKVLKLLNLAII